MARKKEKEYNQFSILTQFGSNEIMPGTESIPVDIIKIKIDSMKVIDNFRESTDILKI